MWSNLQSWWSQPFRSDQSVWNWALTIGLILVLILLWSRVIAMFVAMGEAVTE